MGVLRQALRDGDLARDCGVDADEWGSTDWRRNGTGLLARGHGVERGAKLATTQLFRAISRRLSLRTVFEGLLLYRMAADVCWWVVCEPRAGRRAGLRVVKATTTTSFASLCFHRLTQKKRGVLETSAYFSPACVRTSRERPERNDYLHP